MTQRKNQVTDKKTSPKAVQKKKEETPKYSPERRQSMIAETAWLIAENRDFQGDSALDDWLQAESKTDTLLAETEI